MTKVWSCPGILTPYCLPNLQWCGGRDWLLTAHIPLLFGCRLYNGKILQTTKPREGSSTLEENESLCLPCRLWCERQEATKGHRGVVSLPLILSVPPTKAKPSAVQARKQWWPKDFKRTCEECQTLWIKKGENKGSHTALCVTFTPLFSEPVYSNYGKATDCIINVMTLAGLSLCFVATVAKLIFFLH